MIGRLRGTLIAKQPPWLLIDVQGVGYEVEAPMSTVFRLPALGETVTLETHFVVREDAQLLYGFATAAERALFRAVIKISGIGPKLALAILSGIGVEDFWSVIRNGDPARLVKLPGIGKKTAERIVIELRDKAGELGGAPGFDAGGVAVPASAEAEAKAALEALGYKPAEAQKLVDSVKRDGASTDTLIREALRKAAR